MRRFLGLASFACGTGIALLLAVPPAGAVEPGVDLAVPRMVFTSANGLSFTPSSLRIEPGDYVRFRWISGFHTTTSGASCLASGLWTSNLNSTVTSFTRQFDEAPGSFPFFCQPHCGSGMVGTVLVTTPIDLSLVDLAGMTQLNWTGGGGLYRIFRSDNALFNAATVLTPPAGTNLNSFADQTGDEPAAGTVFFYLVMNQ